MLDNLELTLPEYVGQIPEPLDKIKTAVMSNEGVKAYLEVRPDTDF